MAAADLLDEARPIRAQGDPPEAMARPVPRKDAEVLEAPVGADTIAGAAPDVLP